MDAEGAPSRGLFASARFHVIESQDFPKVEADKIVDDLVQNGAEDISRSSTDATEKIELAEITHIVSTTIDFPEYDAASESLKNVVKPDWVTSSISKGRLANPRQYSPNPKLFFSGLIVCCADLPQGDSDAIIGGVLAAGGLHSSPVTKMVTHIVALTIDNDKCRSALAKDVKCKIVLPHWFDDCLKLGQRIDEGPYCLPDPELLRKRPEERILDTRRQDLKGASTARPDTLPTPTSSPSIYRRELNVFKNKKIMLSSDLEISSHLRGTIEDLIVSGGGNVTGSIHKADIYVCLYRDSLDYRIASRAGRDVGNLSWLYFLITHNIWTSPMKRLLHYPIARQGLPGFKNFRISLSNYNGEARVYLENLAKAAGGEFTKTMKEDNTHLITAHTVSEKCDAAKEWNINMVNHLWLEESYAKWQIQTTSNNRYTHFPTRTNLGEVVGRTSIDKQAAERFFFPEGPDVDNADQSNQGAKPLAIKDPKAAPSRTANRLSATSTETAKAQYSPLGLTKSKGSTPRISKENHISMSGVNYHTPGADRIGTKGREFETPSTTGSRSAKDKAVAKLHELAPDIALYEKESKRVGGVIHGGKRRPHDQIPNVNRKRASSDEDGSSAKPEVEPREVKRAKKNKGLAAPTMRMLLSGYKRWLGNPEKEKEDRARLRELGILVTLDVNNCTHLAAPTIVRTQKFICALAHAPVILSTDFVDDCLTKNELLDPDDYLLDDQDGEKKIGHTIADALDRAKNNKGRLLRGLFVYCTESIHGGFETYKAIVEANGGKCFLYHARGKLETASRSTREGSPADLEDEVFDYIYLVSGHDQESAKLWSKFRQAAGDRGKTPRIVRGDWMLNLALSQRIQWKDEYELTEQDVDAGL